MVSIVCCLSAICIAHIASDQPEGRAKVILTYVSLMMLTFALINAFLNQTDGLLIL